MAHHFSPIALAAATLLGLHALDAAAQSTDVVTITGKGNTDASIGGFGNVPAARAPMQAAVYGREALADWGVTSLGDLTRLDASLADAYNAEGYWSFLTMRGFVIDNRANYRRDGLPINAETFLSLVNVERIEVLKGTSGIQAGTSAPGGLVNLVVKRPTGTIRQGTLSWQQDGTVNAQVDLSQRFGAEGQFGARLNAQAASLRPATHNVDGKSRAFALATDWQLGPNTKLEFEFESSHRSQPSAPGFSMLGNRVPSAREVDPRTNLNNQAWSLPVVLDGEVASLRFTQRLGEDWQFSAHGATQRLRSDDRVAFPFGCYDAAADVYWADRYCPDGSVDLYDFRSDGERRRVDALDLQLQGVVAAAGMRHRVAAGFQQSRTRDRFGPQAFNFSGTGRIDGSVATPASRSADTPGSQRNERSGEWYLRDAIELNNTWQLWAGLRHSRLQRDGAIGFPQSFTTPWSALSFAMRQDTVAYASWGQGIESEVVPNLPIYANANQALTAQRSRQLEAGVKHDGTARAWSIVTFDIRRPVASDICSGETELRCMRAIDGAARHRGLEAAYSEHFGPWFLQLSGLALRATREGAGDASLNGLRPTNVPTTSLRLLLNHDVAAMPGLSVHAGLTREGSRMVLPDNSASIPGWARLDLGARYRQAIAGTQWLWRVDLQNAANLRAWRESPYQFSHVYLFPMSARSLRASVQVDF